LPLISPVESRPANRHICILDAEELRDFNRGQERLTGLLDLGPVSKVPAINPEVEPQILRLTTPRLRSVWGPVRSG